MRRGSSRDALTRSYMGIARGTLRKADDSKKMQAVTVDVGHDESMRDVELPSPYGFKSVPKAADAGSPKAAEVFVGFLNGNRSHPVVLAHDDRRHRPQNWSEGEAGLYDDQGQTVHITRGGIKLDGAGKPQTFTVGNANVLIESDKITLTVGGMKIIMTALRIDLGGLGGSNVVTAAGPSQIVFAKLTL